MKSETAKVGKAEVMGQLGKVSWLNEVIDGDDKNPERVCC